MSTFYIADLHFGHANCLKFDNRPFADIDTHDEQLIERWNSAVSEEDETWILGDLSWKKPDETAALLDRLNGAKNLIVGNHDKNLIRSEKLCSRFKEITPYRELHIRKGLRVVLCHYPIPCFNRHFSGWIHLYGHVHMSPEWTLTEEFRRRFEQDGYACRMINIGCMLPYMDYTPRTLEEIAEGYDGFRNDNRGQITENK